MPIFNIDDLIKINSEIGHEEGKSDKDKFINALANDIATSHKKPIEIIKNILTTDKLARVYFRKYMDEFLPIINNNIELNKYRITSEQLIRILENPMKRTITEKVNPKLNWYKKYESELINDGFEAEFNIAGDNLVTIEIIGVPKEMHGKGYGSIIMKTLTNYADNNGIVLQLRPAASSTHSRAKLIKFYSKFGFIENKGKASNENYQYMYRLPKNALVEKILKEAIFIKKNFFLKEAENGTFKYAVVKANINIPEIKNIQSKIKKDDVFQDEDNTMGLEDNPHVTLLYGLHKNVTVEDVKEAIDGLKLPKEISIKGISKFENSNYDVLKFDVEKKDLTKINTALKKLPYTNKFDVYNPHVTIAYLKKGKAEEYIKNIKDIIGNYKVKSIDFVEVSKAKHKLN